MYCNNLLTYLEEYYKDSPISMNTEYRPDGTVKSTATYFNDYLDGLTINYYNGNRKEYLYQDGVLIGLNSYENEQLVPNKNGLPNIPRGPKSAY